MKRYQITLEGQTFDVRLLSDPRQEHVQVEVDGVAFAAQVKALPQSGEPGAEAAGGGEPSGSLPTPAPGPTSRPQTVSTEGNVVTAPLPGVVKLIAVTPGQKVTSGDQLLVIEAMKMDNIIRASRDGTIDKIHVIEGHQVAYGERMIEYARGGPA